jgi:uroporphyrinogen decarboxylase
MTTHRERMEACLRGETVDRPPVALWRHFPVDDQSPELLSEAHLAFQSMYDFDLVKVTPASSFSVADWGIADEWEGNTEGTRTYTRRVIHEPRDWGELRVLEPDAPHLARQLRCLRLIRAALGPDTPVLQTVFNPLSQAKHLASEATLLEHIRSSPDFLRAGLQTIAETTRRFIAAAVEAGADGIFYAVQHAQRHLLSQREFEGLSRDDDLSLLESAGVLWCNMLHVHGEGIHFAAFRDYPAQIINWHDRESGPPLDRAGDLWPRALCGGLSRRALVLGHAAEVGREAGDALASMHRRRLLLSTGCVVPIVAPHGNIVAAAGVARISKEEPHGGTH